MTRNITEQVPVGQLMPNITFYMSDPSDLHVPPCYRTDTLDPPSLVWVCYPATTRRPQHLLPRGCWVITREAPYDERPVVIATRADRGDAIRYAKAGGVIHDHMQIRVYRHGTTCNWYDRKHSYQTGARRSRLYELKHGEGARRPIPTGVGQLAANGLDVLGLGQPK